jgi:hypothetical protein
MILVEDIVQFNENNIFFCESIKNNIITNGNFIRILYSNDKFILNGIYLHILFHNIIIEKYFNKYKCTFVIHDHLVLIETIRAIENSILRKINRNMNNKTPIYKIDDLIRTGNIKIFTENPNKINNEFLLKISGIWEDSLHYGVTYKFIPIIRQ